MSNFPLYDSLMKGISVKCVPVRNKDDFITKVNKIDVDGHELVYALVRVYQLQHDTPAESLPYGGKYKGCGDMEFDFNMFPDELKQLLYKFVKIHANKMAEDEALHENRIISPI
jgi:hypothetical protein